jgi:hypothetical protein
LLLEEQKHSFNSEIEKKEIIFTDEINTLNEKYVKEISDIDGKYKGEIKVIEDGFNDKIKNLEVVVTTLIEEKEIEKKRKKYIKWRNIGIISLIGLIIILILGVLEFLPPWEYNYPSKLLDYLDLTFKENEMKRYSLKTLNYLILSGSVIGLFKIFYNRVISKNKKIEFMKNN